MHRLALSTLLILSGGHMQPAFAQSPVAVLPSDAAWPALAEAAARPVSDTFGGQVEVALDKIDVLGRWAFVQGRLQAPGGGRADYGGTAYAERAEQGGMSDVYVALLRREAAAGTDVDAAAGANDGAVDDAWMLIDHAIGPGDVAWLAWPGKHAVPRQLFGF